MPITPAQLAPIAAEIQTALSQLRDTYMTKGTNLSGAEFGKSKCLTRVEAPRLRGEGAKVRDRRSPAHR